MKPIVLIDLDDTVWEFFKPLLDRYNETFNTGIEFEEITEYDFSDKIHIPIRDFFEQFLTEQYFETFKPYEATVETINQLVFCDKYIIKFLSAGSPRTAFWRLKKLENLFGWFTPRDLILCQDKQLVKGTVLIDDCLDNFKKSSIGCPSYYPIVPDKPWNRNHTELKQCYHRPIKIFQWDFEVLSQYIDERKEAI